MKLYIPHSAPPAGVHQGEGAVRRPWAAQGEPHIPGWPDLSERVTLAERLTPEEALDRANRHVRDALLPRLVPGKVRVGDAEKYIRKVL